MGKTTIDALQEQVRGRVLLNAPMAQLTTIKVGGPADILVYPADRDDLACLLRILREGEVPLFVLGNGSNLVVRDAGIRGAVVSLAEGFKALERLETTDDRVLIRAEAGVTLRWLSRWSVDQGIGGLEALFGIPGTIGGAVAMNAGSWGVEISDHLVELEMMDPQGTVITAPRESLTFGYRSFELPDGHIILSAVLWGEPRDGQAVKLATQEYGIKRRAAQPLQDWSAGSIFKNPPGKSAGNLIDGCGLKGVKVGDAEVSRAHANFIVNTGMATAAQVVALIGMIQERVHVKFQIRLEPEVRIVGDWEKGKLRITE